MSEAGTCPAHHRSNAGTKSTFVYNPKPSSAHITATSLAGSGRCRFRLAELPERRLETGGEFVRCPCAPVMQEVNGGPGVDHVLVDGHDVEAVLAQRLQN